MGSSALLVDQAAKRIRLLGFFRKNKKVKNETCHINVAHKVTLDIREYKNKLQRLLKLVRNAEMKRSGGKHNASKTKCPDQNKHPPSPALEDV